MDKLYIQTAGIYPTLTLSTQPDPATTRDRAMEFEWDEEKRLKVLDKHGIDFWRATALWDGNHVVLEARIGDEYRQKVVGFLDGWWVVVVFTRRGEKLRLVTARRAREDEKRAYRSVYN